VDAKDKILGRLAPGVANILHGKDKPFFTPHIDCGDFVVVINAGKVRLSGNKLKTKMDFRHSGYPGGQTLTPYEKLLREKPQRAIELAVSGMLPKNRLRSRMMRRLKVYRGPEHPHNVQFAKPDPSHANAN